MLVCSGIQCGRGFHEHVIVCAISLLPLQNLQTSLFHYRIYLFHLDSLKHSRRILFSICEIFLIISGADYVFCPFISRQRLGLCFRWTLELNVSFLPCPYCGGSATSQPYSLWKLFSQSKHRAFLLHRASGQLMSKCASLVHNCVGAVQSKYIKILYSYHWSPASTDLCAAPHKTFMLLFVYVEPTEIKQHSIVPFRSVK